MKEITGNWRKNFDYRFISGEELVKDVQLTIKAVGIDEAFNSRKNEKEDVLVLSFIETDKMMVLNKTNSKSIAQLTGSQDVENWIGHKITLFGQPDSRHGQVVRVKPDFSHIKPKA